MFGMDPPPFDPLDAVHNDIARIKNVWGIYEEFQQDLAVLGKEDWVTFRSKIYRFEEFLGQWQEKLKQMANDESIKSSRKQTTKNMSLRIEEDIESYRLLIPMFKWVRGEALSPDHWLELFRILRLSRGTTLEKLTFGELLQAKDEIMKNLDQLKVRFALGTKKNPLLIEVVLGSERSCTSGTHHSRSVA